MRKFIVCILFAFLYGIEAQAALTYQGRFNPNLGIRSLFQQEYPHWHQSIIYVFTSNNPCYECPETVSLIQQIYNQLYADTYILQIINYQDDTTYNYIETFNLNQPLEVVLARVRNGSIRSYIKLDDLPDRISDLVSFQDFFENKVNQYLGN